LAAKIIHTLQHPVQAQQIGQQNRIAAITNHSITHIGPQLEAVYQQLLD
jgi:hypothetical protein